MRGADEAGKPEASLLLRKTDSLDNIKKGKLKGKVKGQGSGALGIPYRVGLE